MTPVGGTAASITAATLQEDGNTVVLTLGAGDELTATATNYIVNVQSIVSAAGETMAAPEEKFVSLSDATRPSVLDATMTNSSTVSVNFSEPVDFASAAAAFAAIKVYDGATLTSLTSANYTVSLDQKSVKINVGGLTRGKTYQVITTGVLDLAGNVVTPNPVTKSFTLAADSELPTVTDVKPLNLSQLQVTFSEPIKPATATPGSTDYFKVGIDGAPSAAVTGNVTTTDSKTFIVDLNAMNGNADLTAGVHTITVDTFSDLAGNPQTAVTTKLLTFGSDAPKLTNTVGQRKNVGGTNYYVFPVDRPVTVTAASTLALNYVNSQGIESTVTVTDVGNANLKALDTNGDTVIDAIGINADDSDGGTAGAQALAAGSYSGTIGAIVADTAPTPNPLANTAISFTVAGSATQAQVLGAVQTANDPSTLTVSFDKPLDMATALNVNNYKVEGNVIASKAVFVTDTQTVKLTLKPGVIATTSNYTLTVTGVKDSTGAAVKDYNAAAALVENAAPTFTATLVSPSSIKITFSESTVNTGETFDAADDLVVKVNGATVATGNPAYVSGTDFTVAPSAGNFLNAATDVITVSTATGLTAVKDANGNLAGAQTVTVVKP